MPKAKRNIPVKSAFVHWYVSKGVFYRFGLTFLCLALLINAIILLPIWEKPMAGFVHLNASVASAILNLAGERSHAMDGIIYSPQYAITVLPACTAVEFTGVFCAAILAFPAPWSPKLIGMVVGSALLTGLNLLRIMSLYFIGVHLNSLFTAMHEQIWGIIQIPAVICLGLAWVQWVTKNDHLEIRSSA